MNINVRSGVKQKQKESQANAGVFFLEYMTENGMEHIYSENQKLVEDIAEDRNKEIEIRKEICIK